MGLVQTTQRNVQCVTYFLLTESEGRTGRILPEADTTKTEGNILSVRSRASESLIRRSGAKGYGF